MQPPEAGTFSLPSTVSRHVIILSRVASRCSHCHGNVASCGTFTGYSELQVAGLQGCRVSIWHLLCNFATLQPFSIHPPHPLNQLLINLDNAAFLATHLGKQLVALFFIIPDEGVLPEEKKGTTQIADCLFPLPILIVE